MEKFPYKSDFSIDDDLHPMLHTFPALLIKGRRPETTCGGARRGVLRQRLATAAPGGTGPRPPGTTTRTRGARCDRSGSNSGEGSAGPEPKTATVERREASVPRMGRKAPRQAPGLPRYVQAPRVPRKHPYDSRRSAHPFRGCVKRQSKTRAQKTRRGNENGCLKSEYGSAALLVLILRSAQLERFRRLERTYARLET